MQAILTVLLIIVMLVVLLLIIVGSSIVIVEIGSSGDSDYCHSLDRCYY